MSRILCLFCLFICCQVALGQNIVQYKVSKPYCIFSFMEAASGQHNMSTTLREYIEEKTAGDEHFKELIQTFKGIQLDYSFKREEYPEKRRQFRSTYDLIVIALVNAEDLEAFNQRIFGILPISEQQKLVSVLKQADGYYNKLVWNDYEPKLKRQAKALEGYSSQASEVFKTISHFYHSSWTNDIPFTVALYGIPGAHGNTTATPHANSLCVGVLTDEKDHFGRMGVVIHEICHVLYDEQPKDFQHQIEKYFDENQSPYKIYAQAFFDEGLATALGNGWAYKKLSGQLDTSEWYNNEYIEGFAKVLYPMIASYLDKNQQIDKPFIDKAVDLFAQKFPNSRTDYSILINRVTIYSDAADDTQRGELFNNIGGLFQLTNSGLSSPILDPISLESIDKDNQTQMIVIDRNHAETIKQLKKTFPVLAKVQKSMLSSSSVVCFYDSKNRPIIVMTVMAKEDFLLLLEKMKKQKYFDPNVPLQRI